MWEKTLGLPKPLCITLFQNFFAFKFFTCIIRSWMLHLLKQNKTRHIWPRKVDTCFLNTLNVMRGRKVKSRSAHRTQLKPRRMLPSWCKECFMLREKSLACRPWPAVMDLPSEVHVHSHGRSCTEIAADDADNINILASSIFLTTSPKSENCFRMWLLLKVVWLASKSFLQKEGETTFKGLIQSGLSKILLNKFAFKSKKFF